MHTWIITDTKKVMQLQISNPTDELFMLVNTHLVLVIYQSLKNLISSCLLLFPFLRTNVTCQQDQSGQSTIPTITTEALNLNPSEPLDLNRGKTLRLNLNLNEALNREGSLRRQVIKAQQQCWTRTTKRIIQVPIEGKVIQAEANHV